MLKFEHIVWNAWYAKKGVEWDLFVWLIESYGKAEIVKEAVKIFQKMKELSVEKTSLFLFFSYLGVVTYSDTWTKDV